MHDIVFPTILTNGIGNWIYTVISKSQNPKQFREAILLWINAAGFDDFTFVRPGIMREPELLLGTTTDETRKLYLNEDMHAYDLTAYWSMEQTENVFSSQIALRLGVTENQTMFHNMVRNFARKQSKIHDYCLLPRPALNGDGQVMLGVGTVDMPSSDLHNDFKRRYADISAVLEPLIVAIDYLQMMKFSDVYSAPDPVLLGTPLKNTSEEILFLKHYVQSTLPLDASSTSFGISIETGHLYRDILMTQFNVKNLEAAAHRAAQFDLLCMV